MIKPAFVLAVLLGAAPLAAQSTEFGVIYGGSSRSVDDGDGPFTPEGRSFDDNFSFSRSSVEFFYGVDLDEGTMFRIKAGKIDTPVRLALSLPEAPDEELGYDVEGEVQHIDAVIDYRFDESFGSTGLFAGIGLYRSVGRRDDIVPEGTDMTEMDYGFLAGVNAEFPLSRRYSVMLEATHHWTKLSFNPRFLTVGGGLRIAF